MKELNQSDGINRKSFIQRSLLTITGLFLGSKFLASNEADGASTASQESTPSSSNAKIPNKSDELIVLNDRPWNAETPAHLLDDKVTPGDRFFVRNNGRVPENIDENKWTLTIDGESVKQKKVYSIDDLKQKFKHYTYQLTIECGGNGRKEFNPSAKGNQWSVGAVACSEWTGVRLKDVLNDAGVKPNAVYIGYYGKDTHLSGDPDKVTISRGVPIDKAMEDETLIAWAMNGENIPLMNGYPLRLVIGGWPASVSGKWLSRISVRNIVHDGPKMGGYSYRVPKYPVAPGTHVDEEDMKIIERMPVKSIITYPKTGAKIKGKTKFEVRGHAWAGDREIKEVHTSIDFGATWQSCQLDKAVNKNAWQHWKTQIQIPEKGYHEIWARATDSDGVMQPMVLPGWNPKGYLNNACHRIAVKRV